MWRVVILLAATAFVGCGSSGETLVPVQGTVKYQGAPVEGAQVMFTPSKGGSASATTDAQGKYKLTTENPGDGAVLGAHQVTITKMVRKNTADPYSPVENALPTRYASPEASGITKDVVRGGTLTFDFELTD